MEDIRTLIQRATRRLALNDYIHRLHIVAIIVASVAVLAVLAAKATPVIREMIVWWWGAPVLFLLTIATAAVWWLKYRPTPLHVAIEVDERLSLREKLSTAMLCRGRDDAFAQAAIDDAIQVARSDDTRERVNRTFTITPPRQWWLTPVMLLLAVTLGLFLPSGDLFANDETPALTAEQQQEIEELQAEVKQQIQEVAKELDKDPKELEELLAEAEPKGQGALDRQTPEQARRDAFKKLNTLADKIREETESARSESLSRLQNKLSMMNPPEEGPASNLAKSLAKGDFKDAKEALDQLRKQLERDEMTDEQKEQLSQQLQQLGEQLEELAQRNDELEDALKQAGMDSKLAQDPEQLRKALENAENLTEEQKQQLQQMAQAMAQANSMAQSMGGACQNMGAQMAQQGNLGEGGMGMASQLSDLEMMAAEMAVMNARLAKLGSKCQGLGQGMGACQGMGQGEGISMAQAQLNWMQMMQQGNGRGPGMGPRGQGAGGRGTRFASNMQFSPEKANVKNQAGPIIGRRFIEGDQVIRGESFAEFKELVETASSRAQEELNEHMIPTKYKSAMQHYFGELEKKAETVADDG